MRRPRSGTAAPSKYTTADYQRWAAIFDSEDITAQDLRKRLRVGQSYLDEALRVFSRRWRRQLYNS